MCVSLRVRALIISVSLIKHTVDLVISISILLILIGRTWHTTLLEIHLRFRVLGWKYNCENPIEIFWINLRLIFTDCIIYK